MPPRAPLSRARVLSSSKQFSTLYSPGSLAQLCVSIMFFFVFLFVCSLGPHSLRGRARAPLSRVRALPQAWGPLAGRLLSLRARAAGDHHPAHAFYSPISLSKKKRLRTYTSCCCFSHPLTPRRSVSRLFCLVGTLGEIRRNPPMIPRQSLL